MRLWSAPESPRFAGLSDGMARLRWAVSTNGVICLLAALPLFAITLGIDTCRQRARTGLLHPVGARPDAARAGDGNARPRDLQRARDADQRGRHFRHGPDRRGDRGAHHGARTASPSCSAHLPDALWWAVVTLTTTGYGDVVPQTVGGRMIGSVVMVSGILVLALMTGILATGFAEEERRREYLRVWDQVTKVPMFAELGTVTLSEIVGKLRVRHYPPRIVVVRRDEPGDSMFFISEGEVEVRLPRGADRARPGRLLRRDGAARPPAAQRDGRHHRSRPPCWCSTPATSTRSPRTSPRWSRPSNARRGGGARRTRARRDDQA